ncbi:MAG: type VI secretion system-associated protein TagF [Rubrivivax sp.]|jgi:type VI secretion system protein ImpM
MARLGFHGKLPALGDFVSRGWSTEFSQALDRFVQTAMAAAYAETPAPVLESQGRAVALVIRPGIVSTSGWMGLLAPSEDRVGRYFPICVGLETDAQDPAELLTPGWPSRRWTDELLERVLRVQVDAQGAQALMEALPEPARWLTGWCEGTPRPDRLPAGASERRGAVQVAFEGPWEQLTDDQCNHALQAAALAGVHGVVLAEDGAHHIWFADGSAQNGPAFAALFDGRWAHWGWALEACNGDTVVTDGDDLDTRPPGHDGIIKDRD